MIEPHEISRDPQTQRVLEAIFTHHGQPHEGCMASLAAWRDAVSAPTHLAVQAREDYPGDPAWMTLGPDPHALAVNLSVECGWWRPPVIYALATGERMQYRLEATITGWVRDDVAAAVRDAERHEGAEAIPVDHAREAATAELLAAVPGLARAHAEQVAARMIDAARLDRRDGIEVVASKRGTTRDQLGADLPVLA